jgi:hypothetical protein
MKSNQSEIILAKLFKPLLRFAIMRGVKLGKIIELIKLVLVQMAKDELAQNGAEISVSRVSLMTGVHRKDAKELMDLQEPRASNSDVLRKIIGKWNSDKRLLKNSKPRPLTHVGQHSEFADLVLSVQKELNPYSLLFELQRSNAVEIDDTHVRLIQSEYTPNTQVVSGFELVAGDLQDLLMAAEINLYRKPKVPHLHLSTTYDNVPESDLPAIRLWMLKQGAAFHSKARQFLSKFDRDINPHNQEDPRARVSICTFSLSEPVITAKPYEE